MRYPWGEYPGYFGDPPAAMLADATILVDGTLEVPATHDGGDPPMQYRISNSGDCEMRELPAAASPDGNWRKVDPDLLKGVPAAYFAWRSCQMDVERQFGCADLRCGTLGFDPRRYRDVVVFVHQAMRQALFDAPAGDRALFWDDALKCCHVAGDARHILHVLEDNGFRVSMQAATW